MAPPTFFMTRFRCSAALSYERSVLPEPPPGEAPEPIRTFIEQIYQGPQGRAGFEAGEPLLLTPLIDQKKLKEAREAAACPSDQLLPDMDSYAGYLTVSRLFGHGERFCAFFNDILTYF